MAGESILVVDDDAANRKLIRVLLEGEGYRVALARDAREVELGIDRAAPRLILMDVELPDLNGLELTRRLKADPARREVVIIAVTAHATKLDAERARAAGCDDFISKPLDLEALLRRIEDHLARTAPAVRG